MYILASLSFKYINKFINCFPPFIYVKKIEPVAIATVAAAIQCCFVVKEAIIYSV